MDPKISKIEIQTKQTLAFVLLDLRKLAWMRGMNNVAAKLDEVIGLLDSDRKSETR